MTKVVLSVHVLVAILGVGPLAVAVSLFPAVMRRGFGSDEGPVAAGLLHRVSRGYAVVAVAVPVFGMATAGRMNVLTDLWLIISIVLTVAAAALLTVVVLPQQRRLLSAVQTSTATDAWIDTHARRALAVVGVFNLIWAVVVVLMIVRPGSTTGV